MWTDTCVCVRLCAYPRANARQGPAQESEGQDPALPTPAGFCFLLAWRTHAITLPASRMAGRRTGPRLSTWRWKRPHRLSHIVVLNLTIPQSSQGRQEEAPADEEEEAPGPAPGEKTEKRGQQLAPPIDGEADKRLRLIQVLELPEWPLRSRALGLPWRRKRSRKTSSSRQQAHPPGPHTLSVYPPWGFKSPLSG